MQRQLCTRQSRFDSKWSRVTTGNRLSSLFVHPPPSSSQVEDYITFIQSFPGVDGPEVFGLHPNADLTFRNKEGQQLLATLMETQPKQASSSTGRTREDMVSTITGSFVPVGSIFVFVFILVTWVAIFVICTAHTLSVCGNKNSFSRPHNPIDDCLLSKRGGERGKSPCWAEKFRCLLLALSWVEPLRYSQVGYFCAGSDRVCPSLLAALHARQWDNRRMDTRLPFQMR